MNSELALTMSEFRRFANTHIYPSTIQNIMIEIQKRCNTDSILFDPLPQPTIKFLYDNANIDNISETLSILHSTLKSILTDFFNSEDVIKMIRAKMHSEITNSNLKILLNDTLSQIQSGNIIYVSLLFNITVLPNKNVYLYL